MPERNDAEDFTSTLSALSVFGTLRTNLALFSSFARRSVLGRADCPGGDLGFLGVPNGENQLMAHNDAIHKILVALVTQSLGNYLDLKRIKPRLEDPDLERFLDRIGDRERFIRGMTKMRNAVFHVRSRTAWRDRDVVFVRNVFKQRTEEGNPDVVGELSVLLYGFTQQCFMGELKIWPLTGYERLEALGPDLRARMRAGEASFDEIIEAMDRLRN